MLHVELFILIYSENMIWALSIDLIHMHTLHDIDLYMLIASLQRSGKIYKQLWRDLVPTSYQISQLHVVQFVKTQQSTTQAKAGSIWI